MRNVCCLILLYLLRFQACKRRQYMPDDHYDQGILTTRSPEEAIDLEVPSLDSRYFLVKIYILPVNKTGIGARVLPYVVLTSMFVVGKKKDNIKVSLSDDEQLPTTMDVEDMVAPDKGDGQYVVLKLVIPFTDLERPEVKINTIPMVTRTDKFISAKCEVWSLKYDMKPSSIDVVRTSAPTGCNASRICATIQGASMECFPPEGSALACDNRLAGIRINHDNKECVAVGDILFFSNLRNFDSWTIKAIEPRSYNNYDIAIYDMFSKADNFVFSRFILFGALLFNK